MGMNLLFQRNKRNTGYEEVSPQNPLAVAVTQRREFPGDDVLTTSRIHRIGPFQVPGIGTAAAYATGDAFGDKFVIDVPLEGMISNLVFYDLDDEGIAKDLVMFAEDFTATADNAAFAVSDDDLLNSVGTISVDQFYDFGNNQMGIGRPAWGYVAHHPRLWCQFVTRGADNIAAGSIPRVLLVVT